MDDKTAAILVDLVKSGKMEEALALTGQSENGEKDAEASLLYRYKALKNVIDKATLQGAKSIMKALEKDRIIKEMDDIFAMRNSLTSMLEKWITDYLQNVAHLE